MRLTDNDLLFWKCKCDVFGFQLTEFCASLLCFDHIGRVIPAVTFILFLTAPLATVSTALPQFTMGACELSFFLLSWSQTTHHTELWLQQNGECCFSGNLVLWGVFGEFIYNCHFVYLFQRFYSLICIITNATHICWCQNEYIICYFLHK